jgi:hypothetical protein
MEGLFLTIVIDSATSSSRCDFGLQDTLFTIHEDLLCSSSEFFKWKLQDSRKAIQGDCSICTEDVAGFAPVDFCESCGQNFHTKCIDDWLQRERTCPLCRLDWPLPPQPRGEKLIKMTFCPCPDSYFDQYMQWLYTGVFQQDEDHLLNLIYACRLGDMLDDSRYLMTAQQNIIEYCLATDAKISQQCISVFLKMPAIRKFLVDLSAAYPSAVELSPELPAQFLFEVTQRMLLTRPITKADARRALVEYLPDGEDE